LFFLALKGQQHTSPGQRPGKKSSKFFSPERALHVLSDFLCSALSGLKTSLPFTQGVALGWYVAALSGLRKIKSFWELAILVTL